MNDNAASACDREPARERFVAELTAAAYEAALRHGGTDSWLTLELDLWRVLDETLKGWAGNGRALDPGKARTIGGPCRLV
jgi:hypothetical protein